MNRSLILAVSVLGIWLAAGSLLQAAGPESVSSEAAKARRAIQSDNPTDALDHYQKALSLLAAHETENRKAILNGIGFSALWLEDYALAERSYREALTLATTDDERTLFSARLARALSMLDRPHEAYELASPHSAVSREAAVETARAALLMGREKNASEALVEYSSQADNSPVSGWLNREYLRQLDELNYRTQRSVRVDMGYSRDSDGVRVYGTALTASFSTLNLSRAPAKGERSWPEALWNVGIDTQRITDNTSATRVTEVFGSVSKDLGASTKLRVKAGGGRDKGWEYGLGELGLAYRPGDRWGGDLGAERSSVKTITALAGHITYDLLSLGADARIDDAAVLAASMYRQDFSDNNRRLGLVARLNLTPYRLAEGKASLGLQWYGRRFKNDNVNTVGYFNPERFHEQQLRFMLGYPMNPYLVLRATLGVGTQTVNNDSTGTSAMDILLDSRLRRDMRAQIKLGHGDSAAFSSTGAGYRQSYISASLSMPW